MKKTEQLATAKQGLIKYIKDVRVFYNTFRVILIVIGILLFVSVTQGYTDMIWALVAEVLVYIAVTIFCYVNFFMKAVVECHREGDVLCLQTEKKKYSYHISCVKEFKAKGRKFVVVLEDDTSRDSYYFYRNLPFKSYSYEYYTKEEVEELLSAKLA